MIGSDQAQRLVAPLITLRPLTPTSQIRAPADVLALANLLTTTFGVAEASLTLEKLNKRLTRLERVLGRIPSEVLEVYEDDDDLRSPQTLSAADLKATQELKTLSAPMGSIRLSLDE